MSTDRVWAVSERDYPGDRVTAVFPTKALADEFAGRMNSGDADDDDYFVEEFPYFAEVPEVFRTHTYRVAGYIGPAGETLFKEPVIDVDTYFGPAARSEHSRSGEPRLCCDGSLGEGVRALVTYCGEDVEACRNAVAEHIARWKAENGHK